MLSTNLASALQSAPRGIYKLRADIFGAPAWYAWTGAEVVDIYRLRDGETTAFVLAQLSASLDRHPAAPTLTLVAGHGPRLPASTLGAFVPPPLRRLP